MSTRFHLMERLILFIFFVSKSDHHFSYFMVHYLPLFKSQDLHALVPSKGRILKLPLSLIALRHLSVLTGSFILFLSGKWSSLWEWLANFLTSCQVCVKTGEACGVHHLISDSDWQWVRQEKILLVSLAWNLKKKIFINSLYLGWIRS